ncbi:protein kinase [Planomonospora sp. ID67723]|uniref:protein kinase domain-containing protein n=1 Tax=Planomonospora sp. ID67723 TaxID=2738134 RepID=UPI0018C3A786|nr:protein kinase [Planomonospora sp. ID67723]MBG0827042.1 protein kinase [Planomonospora sp. ID67723]
MTSLLSGRYRPLGRIAAGGMGEVWRARDELLAREVAVKLLRTHVAADPHFRERFRTEARIAAGLADPGIAQVYDYGEDGDVAYLVMELVSGESLANILARNGTLGAEVTLDVVAQTARALHAAHRSGIIHRDVKPGNLLVTETGTVKITDFGIARALEAAPVTQTGTVLGTAQYVSPEQASGTTLTPATDLYSLGVVAYECLAGRPPFVADNQVAIALMHLNDPPPPLPESVPAAVRDLVTACLAKDPARRPAGASELANRAHVLRESLVTAGAMELSMLTDPVGRPAAPGSVPPDAAWAEDVTQDSPAPYPGPVPVGGPDSPPRTAEAVRMAPGRRGLRRAGVIVVVTAGCAAAVGLGTLAIQDLSDRRDDGGSAEPFTPPTPGTRSPTAKPGRSKPATTRPSASPAKSPRSSPSPSATVSTSATPTARPTKPPTPSPSPTTQTPPPPTPTVTPSLTPSDTPDPGDTTPPNGET